MSVKTIKVRIAVAVDEAGDWYAIGYKSDPNELRDEAKSEIAWNAGGEIAVRWVTANVPLPADEEDIAGEVE